MSNTLIRIVESKKFVMGILGVLAGLAAKWGWHVDTVTIAVILSPIGIAIGAEGWADSSPQAADKLRLTSEYREQKRLSRLARRTPSIQVAPGGFVRPSVMITLVLFCLPILMAPSCSGVGTTGGGSGSIAIDCTTSHLVEIADLFAELKNILTGSADWNKIRDKAVNAGEVVGGCALAELVQDYLGGKVAVQRGDGQVARRTLEDFRATHARNATFHTPVGDL